MRKLTSIIALLLALIMLLSFCACQTPSGDGEDTTGDNLTVETFTGDFAPSQPTGTPTPIRPTKIPILWTSSFPVCTPSSSTMS